jgi:hypothetical protein
LQISQILTCDKYGFVVAIFNHFNEMNGDRMFYTKDHKTIDMFDNFAFLESKRRTLLDTTWASIFRDKILPVLPVELLSATYHNLMGRRLLMRPRLGINIDRLAT